MSYATTDLRFRSSRLKPAVPGRTSIRPLVWKLPGFERMAIGALASLLLCLLLHTVVTAAPASFTGGYADATRTFPISDVASNQAATKSSTHGASVHTPKVMGRAAAAYFAQFSPKTAAIRKANAQFIVRLGNKRGLSEYSNAITVATAIQESGLDNKACCDAKSHGWFQQQWNQGWGTLAQTLDPTHETNAFINRLVRIPDRDSRPMRDVAIQIQHPAVQYYYRDWRWDMIALQIVQYYSVPATTGHGRTT